MATQSSRYERILDGVDAWTGFYRANPQRFVRDFLHIKLRVFQSIILVMMNICYTFIYIASRGQGKTYICAIFCCVRAILYPGTKICIASGTRGQAANVLEKITLELKPKSPELAHEIDDRLSQINGTKATLVFKNGSYIKVVTAGETARGNRANILILDEFRLIDKDTIDTILDRFLSVTRTPDYVDLSPDDMKVALEKEYNQTLLFSSAYYQDHWSYKKCIDTFTKMLQDDVANRSFICGLPWQLSVEEGLLRLSDVEDDMSASDFSEVKWSMEMGAIWYGSSDDAFFDFETVSRNRRIKYPMLPTRISSKLSVASIRIPPKQNGEIRILSADIALMSSKKNKNDATAVFVNQMLPTKAGRYINNIVYADSFEGLRTEAQALEIRKLYDEFECDYIALDSNGIGLGVFDCIAREMVDSETGEIYPALSCINDKTMAERCTVPNADKVIWSIKASANLNSDAAYLLREGFKSGRIRLLMTEEDADGLLGDVRGFGALTPPEKAQFMMPYIQTTLLIDELVKLQHEESGGRIKVFEKSGMRKDRYSSLLYNFYVATQIESKLSRKNNTKGSFSNMFFIKPPSGTEGRGGVSGTKAGNGWRSR